MRGRIRLDQSLRMLGNTIGLGRIRSENEKEKISIANSGENNGMFGKPSWNKGLTSEIDNRIYSCKNINVCLICGINISRHATHCRKHTPIFKRFGINNSSYKNPEDRITSLNTAIRKLNIYSDWRTQVFGRDNFTCQKCGVRGSWLEAHHIVSLSDLIIQYNIKTLEDVRLCPHIWDINNGITYCKKCHNLLNKKGGLL